MFACVCLLLWTYRLVVVVVVIWFTHGRFYQKYQELRARIKANSCPVLPATPIGGAMTGSCGVINNVGTTANATALSLLGSQSYLVQRSASLKDHRQLRYGTIVLGLVDRFVLYAM